MDYRVALVTGSASGLGRRLTLDLARSGVAVAAIDRSAPGLEAIAAELPATGIACHTADVCDPASMQAAIDECERRLGPIELVIACAGINVPRTDLNLKADDFQKILAVNIVGVANTFAPVLPGMLSRRRGHLVAISSMASLHGLPHMLAYCASKSGLNAWIDGLRIELIGTGVHLTTVCPGWIDTVMNVSESGPMPGMVPQEEASRQIFHAIRRKKRFHAFPRSQAWQLRLLKLLPGSWQDRIIAHVRGPSISQPL